MISINEILAHCQECLITMHDDTDQVHITITDYHTPSAPETRVTDRLLKDSVTDYKASNTVDHFFIHSVMQLLGGDMHTHTHRGRCVAIRLTFPASIKRELAA